MQAAQATLRDLTGFGAAADVKQSALPGVEDIDTKTEGKQKKIKTTSQDILNLTERLQEARFGNNQELAVQTEYLIRNQKLAEKFQAGEIDANTFKVGLLESENKLREDGIRLRKQAKNGEIEFNQELTKTEKLFESIKETVATGLTNAITGLIDGTKTLSESLSGILNQIANMVLQFGVSSAVDAFFPSAKGNVFSQNKIVPFAYGGVVNKPTLFPLANGTGLMGEAGPEAIMPLRRGRGGRLGVEATGSGMANVVVNVDAKGTATQGDSQSANQLGQAIGAAVQAELIKQKRAGGLLSR